MTTETAESYFRRNGIKYKRQAAGTYGVNLEFACPVCGKAKKAQINNATWLWKCHAGSCDAKGNEITLKRARGDIYEVRSQKGDDLEKLRNDMFVAALKARASTSNDVEKWAYDLWHNDAAECARDYLASRGISDDTAKRAYLGWSPCWPGKEKTHEYGMLMIPVLTEPGQTDKCAMVKVRTLNPDVPKSSRYRRLAGGESILYAPNGLSTSEPLLLVGGEVDVLSVMQAGYSNVCSTTTGEDSWSDVYTKQLAEHHDVVIIYDNDPAGRKGAELVVSNLGVHRCRVGKWPGDVNDANDILKADLSDFDIFAIQTIINDAKVPKLAGIISPSSLRDKILTLLDGSGSMGWKTGWPDLDIQLGGWRPGEVTLVTGDTGCGKTSFTSQAGLFQAIDIRHGVLYCPLEMGPLRQVLKWLRQMARSSPKAMSREVLDGWMTSVSDLPLHIFYTRDKGNVEAWRNTLMYAFSRLGVRFVVLDHIHAAVNAGNSERIELENIAQMLAEVAVDTGMHIVNVAHPHQLATPKGKKDGDNVIVQLTDLKGTSALKQFSDNVLSIWRSRKADRSKIVNESGYGTSIVYLLKVRDEDGQEGRVPFRYHVEGALMLNDAGDGGGLFTHKENEPKPHWTDNY